MTAHRIATLIRLVGTATFKGELPLETGSVINRDLWDLAREKGLAPEVDAQLQEWSLAEMQAATRRAGLPQDGSAAI